MAIEIIKAKAVLSDIVGTISSEEGAKREAEYFRTQGAAFIDNKQLSEKSTDTVRQILNTYKVDTSQGVVDSILAELDKGNLIPNQMGVASEIIAFGYNTGQLLHSDIYEDVPSAFRSWKKNKAGIYTFSNGTVELQQAMLRKAALGDISGLVDGYFDTMMVGSKKSADSFKKVQDTIGVDANKILFISDSEKELVAADKAGCYARLVVRPGNNPVETQAYGRITDLTSIVIKND